MFDPAGKAKWDAWDAKKGAAPPLTTVAATPGSEAAILT